MSASTMVRNTLVAVAVMAVAAAILWFALSRSPAFDAVPPDASRLVAGDPQVAGELIAPFSATYRRTSKIFGLIPVMSQQASLVVHRPPDIADSSLDVTITMGASGVEDRILLDPRTLSPRARAFTLPGGGEARLTFDGSRVRGSLTQPDETVRDLAYDFDGPVFEVSLLELLFAALPLQEGFLAHIAWDNMLDPEELWAQIRVAGREVIRAESGREYDTWLVKVMFASGNQRWFWIAREPPYKIRVINFTRGRAVFSVWDLIETR